MDRKPAMDERILKLADVINSAAPAGAQAVLKYNLRTVPGMSSPIQRQNVPVIRLENKVYESAWQRAARKVKIVTMFRRMGRERERRRRSDDSKLSSEDDKTITLPIGSERRTYILKSPNKAAAATSSHQSGDGPIVIEQAYRPGKQTDATEKDRKQSLSSNVTDEFGMKAIAIQTDKPRLLSPPPVKAKKMKRKARSQQVQLPDSHLSLQALREQEKGLLEKSEEGKSKVQVDQVKPGKNDDGKTVSPIRPDRKKRSANREPAQPEGKESRLSKQEHKIRNDRSSEKNQKKDTSRRKEQRFGSDEPRQKHQSGSQILLYEGRMKKEDYDPNLDDRMEKYLATKAEKIDSELKMQLRLKRERKQKRKQQEPRNQKKRKLRLLQKPNNKLSKRRRKMICCADDVEAQLRPPGDPELENYEHLFAADQERPEDLDPEIVARVEEQIFEKIKFFKDVQGKVREKQWVMRKKMKLRAEARAYISRFEGVSSGAGGPGFGARLMVSLSKASRELANYSAMLIPWEGKIKNIESYFGSVVASYFTFLRWLFWINFIMALICGVVIIMPEVMFGPDMGTVPYKSVPAEQETEASYLKTLWNFNGYAQVSPIFYGYYSSIKRYDSGFRMPFAYMLGNLMMFAYSFYTILRQIADNAKDEKAADKDENFTFSWRAYSSWDYMIGNEETAKNKYKSLIIAIRESITESKESAKKISGKTKFLRFFANFLVLVVLSASTYGIFSSVQRSNQVQQKIKEQGPDSVGWLESNEVSLVVSLVTAFFPMIFDIISIMEDYHPRIALQWSLRRIMVLYLLNLYTLYIALYQKILAIEEEARVALADHYNVTTIIPCPETNEFTTITIDVENLTTTTTAYTTTVAVNATTSIPCGYPEFIPDATCWETMVGQELIKLTVFDFVSTVALIYITEFFRAVLIRVMNTCWCWDMEKFFPAYAEFSLAENLLHLINNQGMVWMGTLFCPGLPALNLFKLLCLFYVRAWSVMVCNVPHERIFKAGSDNFYLMLLLFMLYVVMIPIAFAMVNIKPSRQCGPFANVEYMTNVVTEWMKDVFHANLFGFVKYMASPGALIPILILLFLRIYSLSSSNDALQGTVLDLKKQLSYERTEGKKRVFNMNKAAAEAAPTPTQAPAKPQAITEGTTNSTVSNLSTAMNAAKFIGRMKNNARLRSEGTNQDPGVTIETISEEI